jgi:hypothetical protein
VAQIGAILGDAECYLSRRESENTSGKLDKRRDIWRT